MTRMAVLKDKACSWLKAEKDSLCVLPAYFAGVYVYTHFEGKIPFNYNFYITFKKETLW